MPQLVQERYEAFWAGADPKHYETCCQPEGATWCEFPVGSSGPLPICGFPFGSVDYLPAFLPEVSISLPRGPVRLRQGVEEYSVSCSGAHCGVVRGRDASLEPILLWSTALATHLDTLADLRAANVIDLGAGVGLTCIVLARRRAHVTCTDVHMEALRLMGRNAEANNVTLRLARLNYSDPSMPERRSLQTPYDVVVLSAITAGSLAAVAQVIRSLGRPGTRVFIEDQRAIDGALRRTLVAEAWAQEGLFLRDEFDPFSRGLWPMPRGRIYELTVAWPAHGDAGRS